MSGILIDVNARTSQSEKDLAKINESLRNIEKSTNSASRALSNAFVGITAAVASGGTILALRNISNEFTNIENKIALVTGRTSELVKVQKQLFDIAEDTRGSLSGTVGVFSSFGKALKDVGSSTQNILKATKTVQQAVAISGASAEAASAALVQLGQGLSSGTLRGEELNSVLEQTPRIATAIADELGVTVGRMRQLAADGRLTSTVVFDALLNQSQKISKEFSQLTPTLSQSTNLLTDSVKIYFNELDKSLGLSTSISKVIVNLARTIKASSNDAFEIGNRLALGMIKAKSAVTSIIGPISKIGIELGKQLLMAFPIGGLTRTLKGDLREFVRTVDKELLGGLLTGFNKLRFIDLITVESDVQKALRKLRRLSPSNWAAAGFDTKTIQQVFSRENLDLYAAAFSDLAKAVTNNTNSISGAVVSYTRKVDASFKAISRYFGFRPDTIIAFTRGQVDTFFMTLTEITRGISGIGVKIYEFNRLIIDNVLPGITGFGLAVKDVFKELPKIFVDLVSSVFKISKNLIEIVSQIIKEISYSELQVNIKEILNNVLNIFSDFVDAIENKLNLEGPLNSLRKFGQQVIEIFRDIYDKVIGNSWWTDTVETIVETSGNLWNRASSGLNKFKDNAISLFKNIFNSASNLEFNFSKIKLPTKTILPSLSAGGFLEVFSDTFAKAKELAINFFESFPSIAKAAMVATAGILVYNLFPPSVLKTVILSSILTSLATSGTLIAEKFGAALTGGSLAASIGYALGQGVGFFLNSFIKDLPNILNSLLGFISNFFRGIVEKLPVLGSIISGVFSVFSGLGIAGPAGVLGAYFFGKNLGLFKLLAKLEPLKSFLEFFDIKVGEEEKKSNKKGKQAAPTGLSLVGKTIQNNVGTTRAASIGLLLAQAFGAFESIFANSVLAKYATTGGLLYTTMFGQEGLNKIIDTFQLKILKPIGESLRSYAEKAGGTPLGIYNILFGDTGTTGERIGLFIKPLLEGITKQLVEASVPFVEKGYEFFKTLLLGKSPQRTIRLLKIEARRAFQDFSEFASKLSKPFLEKLQPARDFLDNRRYEAWLKKNANPQNMGNAQSTAFDRFAEQANRTAERVGGERGLLGKLLLGKYSKQILVGSVLAIGTAFAFAAENANRVAQESPFERLANDVKSIDLLGPFKQLSLETVAIIVPTIIGAFVLLRTQLLAIFAEIKAAGVAAMSAAGLGGLVGGRGRRNQGPSTIVTTGAAVAGGAIAGSLTDNLGIGLAVGSAILTIIQMLPAKILKAFTFARLGSALAAGVALLFKPITLAIIGTAALGGAAYVWLFGESGEFFKDLDTAIEKAKELVGIKPSPKPSARGLSQEDEKFIKTRNLETKFSLDNVNLKKLEEADLKKLKDRTQEFADALENAREEEKRYGRITPDTQAQLKVLDSGLQNLTTKLALKTTKQQSPVQAIEDLSTLESKRKSFLISKFVEQTFKDVEFNVNEFVLKVSRAFAPTKELKLERTKRLDELQSLRSTEYNAFYRPLRASEKALLDLARSAENVSIVNDQLELDLMKVRQQYEKNAEVVKGREVSFTGYKPLPESDPDRIALLITELEYIDKLKAKLEFDRQQRAIKAFNTDLNTIETTFKDVLKLDLGDIFAVDNQDIFKLKELEKQARFLGEQIKNVSDIAQKNEITLRITEIKRQVIEIQEAAKVEVSQVRPQFILKDLYEKAGIRRPEAFFQQLSDEAAKSLISATQQYNKLTEDIKNKPFPQKDPLARAFEAPRLSDSDTLKEVLKGSYPRPPIPELPESIRSSGPYNLKSLEGTNAAIIAQSRAIGNAERDFVRGTAAEISLFQSEAERLGVSFDQLISKYGVKSTIANISKLDELTKSLEAAKKSRNEGNIQRFTQQLENLREELSRTPLDFPGVLGQISSGGFTITPEDVLNTQGILGDLKSISAAFLTSEIQFKRLGNAFKQEDIEAILKPKIDASRKLFETFIKTIGNTPNKLFEIFNKFGLSDPRQIRSAKEGTSEILLDLEKLRLSLDELGKKKASPTEFAYLLALKEKLEILSDYVKDNLTKNFSTSFNKINNILETNLSESQFASLPKALTDTLSVYADFLDRNLENVRKKGTTIAGETPKEFFTKFEEYLRKVKFVKFISDLTTNIASVTTDGLRSQFEKFSESVGETLFTKETFAQIPKEQRTQLVQRAVVIKGLESALDLPGLTDAQLSILNKFVTEPENAKAILDEFTTSLTTSLQDIPRDIKEQHEKFLRNQLTPVDRQVAALDNTSLRLQELSGAVSILTDKIMSILGPSASNSGNAPIERAGGGWVFGPGTKTSDSIPALLSDGEFVVNADAAKENKSLLELINDSGKTNLLFDNAFTNPKLNPLDKLGVEIGGGLLKPAKVGKGYGFKWSTKFSDGGAAKGYSLEYLAEELARLEAKSKVPLVDEYSAISQLSDPLEMPRGFQSKLTDWNTKYADFTKLQELKDVFERDLKTKFGTNIEGLTQNDQFSLRKSLDSYYEEQLKLYINDVKKNSLSVFALESDTAQHAINSRFQAFAGHRQDLALAQQIVTPSIHRIPNIRAANAVKAHEFGHMFSFGRTFDTETYQAFLSQLLDNEKANYLFGQPYVNALYPDKTGQNFLETIKTFYSADPKRHRIEQFPFGPKFVDIYDKYKGNLKLFEETTANNIGSALSPLGQIWDDVPTAFRTYQIEDEMRQIGRSDSGKLKKLFKVAPLYLEQIGAIKELKQTLDTQPMASDIPAPEPKPTMIDKLSKMKPDLGAIKDKLPDLGSLKDKFKNPFQRGLSSNISFSDILSKAVGKPSDFLGAAGSAAQGVYGLVTDTDALTLNDDFMTLVSSFITKAKGAGVFQLATYMKELNPKDPAFEILQMWEQGKLDELRKEASKQLYKPNIASKIKKPSEASKLINFEDYIAPAQFTDEFVKKNLGLTDSQLKSLNNIQGSIFLNKAKKKADGGKIFGPGTGLSDSIPAWLSDGEFVVNAASTKKHLKLLEAINSAKGFQSGGLSDGTMSSGSGLKIQAPIDTGALVKAFSDALRNLNAKGAEALPGVSKVLYKAKALNLDFDELKFRALEPAAQAKFEELLNKAYEDQLNASKKKTPELIKQASESLTSVEDFIEDSFPKFVNKARQAGLDFANAVGNSINDAFKDLLKGKADEGKSVFGTFIDRILDNITSKIIDTFVEGLMDPITGKDGLITKAAKDLGSNLFKGGEGTTGILSGLFKKKKTPEEAAKTPVETRIPVINPEAAPPEVSTIDPLPVKPTTVDQQQVDISKGINQGIVGLTGVVAGAALMQGNGFQKLIGILTMTNGILSIIQTITALDAAIPFASGGKVSGPGTGTSDSISAMLSNGEFVVNAKATKKYLPVLEAINTNNFKKFATGGLISTDLVSTPAMAGITPSVNSSTSSQQVVNINITGDISRQTRAQIYQMLPSIAEGVNAQNRERGYRG